MHIPAAVLAFINYVIIRYSQLKCNGKPTGSATFGMDFIYPDDL
jgi:hypothetical protein